jgi:hypothetical protein
MGRRGLEGAGRQELLAADDMPNGGIRMTCRLDYEPRDAATSPFEPRLSLMVKRPLGNAL